MHGPRGLVWRFRGAQVRLVAARRGTYPKENSLDRYRARVGGSVFGFRSGIPRAWLSHAQPALQRPPPHGSTPASYTSHRARPKQVARPAPGASIDPQRLRRPQLAAAPSAPSDTRLAPGAEAVQAGARLLGPGVYERQGLQVVVEDAHHLSQRRLAVAQARSYGEGRGESIARGKR